MFKKKFEGHIGNSYLSSAFYQRLGEIELKTDDALPPFLMDMICAKIDIKALRKKIEKFRRINFKLASISKIEEEIFKVFSASEQKKSFGICSTIYQTLNPESVAYRVRPCKDIHSEIKTVDDFWAPPAKSTKMGRLNLDKKPRFYASKFPDIAIDECNIIDDSQFLLTRYEFIKPVKLAYVSKHSQENIHNELSDKSKEVMYLLDDFIEVELTRHVEKNSEYLYKLSNAILNTIFKSNDGDGWIYPSVSNRHDINICLEPEIARDSLKISCSFIASVIDRQDDGRISKIKLHEVVRFHDGKIIFAPYPIGVIDPLGHIQDGEMVIRPDESTYEDELTLLEEKHLKG